MALERLIGVLSVLVKANTAAYEAGMSKSARETKNAQQAVKAAERDFYALTRQIQNAGRVAQDIGRTLTVGVTLPLVAAGGAAVKTAITWESAFAGVRKTVNASAEELKGLEGELRKLATTIPVPAEKLAAIAQSAGQLGIAKQNIVGFTRVVADLSVATNLTAEQGAQDLARLANITQMPQAQFSNLGSTVVALGNNFATTEQDIVAMALRLAGAGSSIGLTQAQILGLATSLSSVGIEAEAGGSAFSRVMKDMALAVSKGGQELQNFAAVAAKGGVQDFAKVFQEDAAKAVGGFIQGLVNIKREGGDVIGLLDKMGISEIRMSDALLRTAGAGNLVARSLDMATEAWRKNSALTAEAAARYATTESRLGVLKNKVSDLGITLGGALLPGINTAIGLFDRLFPTLQRAAEWFAKLPGGVQLAAVGLLGLVAAAGPAIYVLGSLVTNVGGALRVMQEFGVQAQLMNARALLAAAGARALAFAQAPLVLSLGSVAAAAAAVAVVGFAAWNVGKWIGETTGLTDALGKLFARMMGGQAAVDQYEVGMRQRAAQASRAVGQEAEQAAARVKQLQDQLSGAATQQGVNDLEQAVLRLQAAGQLTKDTLERVAQEAQRLQEAGGRIGPRLQEVLRLAEAQKRFAGFADILKGSAKGPADPGVVKTNMSPEQQAKALVQVQGELAKVRAQSQGTYASMLADIRASIATRLQEAAGVAALTGALLTLQTAQIQAAQRTFIKDQLGAGKADYALQVQNIADAVALAGQLGQQLSGEQIDQAGQKLAELQAKGAEIPPALEAILERFRGFEEAARGVEMVNALFAEQQRLLEGLEPTAQQITNSFLELERSVELRTGTQDGGILAGLDKLSEGQLETVVKQLREMQQAARAAGVEVPGLTEALGAAWRRLQDLQAGPTVIHQIGEATAAGSEKTIEWSERVRDLAAAFQVLGLSGKSGLGQLLGGLTAGASAFEQLKKAGTVGGKFDLGNIFKGPGGKVGFGSIVGGISSALQGASAAISIGKAVWGLFTKSPVEKAAEKAGKYLGQKVSDKLAQAILDDSKKLGITIQQATLLHLNEALSESGRSVASASAQIGDLFIGIKNGSIPAAKGVAQLGDLFHKASEEAASIGKAYNGATVAMIEAARKTGIEFPGMAEAVAAGLDRVVSGFEKVVIALEDGKYMGGLDPTFGVDPDQVAQFGKAQGQLFVDSFWVVVGERGLVAGADAFRESFGRLRDGLKDLFPPDMLAGLLGPVERLMNLTAPGDDKGPASLFRGAALAAQGLKDVIDGLAQSGYLTAESLANSGTLAMNAFQQAKAGGATDKEALEAIKPLLQSNLDAAKAYGLQLDENTQKLVDQAQAEGLTFKVDPMMQMVDLLKAIATALGAEIPQSAQTANASLNTLGENGQRSAQTVTGSFQQMGQTVSTTGQQAATSFNDALTAGMAQAVGTTATASQQMADASEAGWARIGSASTNVLDLIDARLDPLRSGITVPLAWKWEGGEPPRFFGGVGPGLQLPGQPEIPRAAKGLYTKASPGGSYILTGEAGRDEITAPVDAVLRRGFDAAAAPMQAIGSLVARMDALLAENRALRGELGRLADRPLEAAVHLDGRELADSHVEQLARGNTKLEAAHRRAAAGQRKP